jgi:hypothetical protein
MKQGRTRFLASFQGKVKMRVTRAENTVISAGLTEFIFSGAVLRRGQLLDTGPEPVWRKKEHEQGREATLSST